MTGSSAIRWVRIAIVTLLFAAVAIAPSHAAPVSSPHFSPPSFQDDQEQAGSLPGFGALPDEATLLSSASGTLDEPIEAPATLIVERLSIEPGATLDPVDGPQIVQVEQGLLTFEDDLGLEAEIVAGGAQFFAAGAGDAITNTGDEAAIIVRTSVSSGAAAGEDETPDDASDQEQSDGEGETRDRDDRDNAENGSESAGVNARLLQSTPAPDEVVLTLSEDGFDPDAFEIVQGGELVIENATEEPCTFEVPELSIEVEIGAGDIESVTVDGSAGTHEFTCTNEDGDVVGEGSFFLARPETTPEPVETEEPAASPAIDETTPVASPEPDDTETVTPTETAETGAEATMGVLLEATLDTVPEDEQSLFAAEIVLDPEGSLSLAGAGGSIGIAVSGGDLTVTRPGSSPARLRDGRSVLLPEGIIATLTNNGDSPITLHLAGLTGTGAGDNTTAAATEEPTDEAGSGGDENGPIDQTGANQFIPSDAEMEQIGLLPQRNGRDEVTDPADNSLWFEDQDQAAELLPTFGWQSATLSTYDSDSEETAYGEVAFFVINVDVFDDDGGAADLYTFVQDEVFGGQGRSSDVVVDLDGVDQEMYVSFYNSDTEFDVGFMVIQSGEYVITLYAQGSDLDATALMEDVASLIFGPRG
jgi:hypothetical protein